MKKLVSEGRLGDVNIKISDNSFEDGLKNSPRDSVHFISFEETDINMIYDISKIKDKTFVFTNDSGKEGILS